MYEMTAAELDAELAIELPDRALMKKAKISVKNATIKNSVLIAANQQNNLHQEAYGGNANGGNGGNGGKVEVEKAHDVWAQSQGGNGGNGGDASATNIAYQTNVIAVWNN